MKAAAGVRRWGQRSRRGMSLAAHSLLVMAGGWLSGCASTPLPPEAVGVTTAAVSSPSVEIHRPRIIVKDGELRLEAYALMQWKAETTANTHVDVVFLDAGGTALAVETTNFYPRSLPKTMRKPAPHAYLLYPLRIPARTRTVEVRAHDGPHEIPAPGRTISTPN